LEQHWDTWITEEDWDFMRQHGINTVRIPIGYYHLSSPEAISGTEFASFGSIYEGAWARISTAIGNAYRRGMGVLIDLHAAPGKQNHDSHGGTSGEPQFFSHRSNMQHATNVLCILLQQIQQLRLPNVVGIELLNEPSPPSTNGDPLLQGWYTETIRRLQAIDPLMPVFLGECWRTDSYADYLSSPEMESIRTSGCIVALDHHLYRCFTNEDIHTHISEHARRLKDSNDGTPSMFARVSNKLGNALIVGEWSAALNPGSMNGVHSEDEAKREYVHAQLQLYEQYTAGWFFWTYKKSSGRDTGWGWRDAVQAGVFPAWVGFRAPSSPAQNNPEGREQAKNKAQSDHEAYWNQYPGDYEHWRLGAGFTTGWDDAHRFFSYAQGSGAPLPELGYKGAWAKRRAAEHAREYGSKSLWEFGELFDSDAMRTYSYVLLRTRSRARSRCRTSRFHCKIWGAVKYM
jgi:glucan 1,3-beta-glucosidase